MENLEDTSEHINFSFSNRNMQKLNCPLVQCEKSSLFSIETEIIIRKIRSMDN